MEESLSIQLKQNIERKRDIVHYEQFLLFSQCFYESQLFKFMNLCPLCCKLMKFHCICFALLLHVADFFFYSTISQMTNFSLAKTEGVCIQQFLIELLGSSPKGWQTFVSSNFSFSHSVLKRFVMQTGKNQGLFGKLKG